jgi:hypothetical protein
MSRIKISVTCLLGVVACLAVDFAVMRALSSVVTPSTRMGLSGTLPMANLLAVYLVLVVSRLMHGGEVPLSRITFLLVGGAGIVVLVYVAALVPYLFFRYIHSTAGPFQSLLLSQAQKTAIAQGRMLAPVHRIGIGLIGILMNCVVLNTPLLLPALFAGWATRGYRLKLVKRHEVEGHPPVDIEYY